MKRQHIFILLVLVVALAVALYQTNSSSPSDTKSRSDEVTVTTPVNGAGELEGKEAPSEDLVSAGTDVDTSTKETTQGNDEAMTETSEQVSAKIKENLAGARKILQQKKAIETAKPEDVHHMPKVTLDAAKRLGEIAELEAQHPEQAESFREFYRECALDENTMTVTRAQCLDKFMKASKLDAAEQKQFLSDFPEEIVRLVEALQ